MARRLLRLAAFLVAALIPVVCASWLAGSFMVRGERAKVGHPSAPARAFILRSVPNVRLAATYWPGRRANAPGVLLLHGVGASQAATYPTARWLAAQGYAVLTLDFRGHGGSTLTSRSFGWREADDAHAGFAWLRRQQRGARVAVIGISMGGAAALIGPAGPLPADALVLQAVYPDIRSAIRNRLTERLGTLGAAAEPILSLQTLPRFGVWPGRLSPLAALSDFRAPVLVVGGEHDRATPPSETRAFYAAAPSGRRMLWLAAGADHAQTSVLATPAYRAVLARFLRATIG